MNVQVYATTWCPDCRAALKFLEKHAIAHTVIDVDADPDASAEVLRRVGKRAVPQFVIDGEWFQPYNPGLGLKVDEIKKRLGIKK